MQNLLKNKRSYYQDNKVHTLCKLLTMQSYLASFMHISTGSWLFNKDKQYLSGNDLVDIYLWLTLTDYSL